MRLSAFAFILVQISVFGAKEVLAQPTRPTPAAIVGDWRLNLSRTHYGPGVDRRRGERFSCANEANQIRCVIRSIRADSHEVTGRFVVPMDGTGAPVKGIPDIDEVQLRRPTDAVVDATFLSRGRAVCGDLAF